MNGKIKDSFEQIKAGEELKRRTNEFVMQKVREHEHHRRTSLRYIIPAAACFLFVFIGGSWLFYTPTMAVSLDINPSIELGINRFDKVISVTGYNDDGKKIAKTLDVKYMNCVNAIETILQNDEIEELMSDGAVMEIGVVGAEDSQSSRIYNEIETCMKEENNTHCYYAHTSEAEKAHDLDLPLAKYRIWKEIVLLDPDITEEDVRNMTMRELNDLIQELKGDNQTESESEQNTNGGHQHNRYGKHGEN